MEEEGGPGGFTTGEVDAKLEPVTAEVASLGLYLRAPRWHRAMVTGATPRGDHAGH